MEYKELMEKLQEKDEPPWEKIGEIDERAWIMLKRSEPSAYHTLIDELEDLCYVIDLSEAERIVKAMRPKGQMWSHKQVEEYVRGKGVTDRVTNWYLCMNMVYNDFYDTARMYGVQSDADFFYSLAKDFITDPDAPRHKVSKYFSL